MGYRYSIIKDDNFNLKGNFIFPFDLAFSIVSYAKCSVSWKYETVFRILEPVSRNTKFRETRSIFSRNTKLIWHEILENFVRKKLECQPYSGDNFGTAKLKQRRLWASCISHQAEKTYPSVVSQLKVLIYFIQSGECFIPYRLRRIFWCFRLLPTVEPFITV